MPAHDIIDNRNVKPVGYIIRILGSTEQGVERLISTVIDFRNYAV